MPATSKERQFRVEYELSIVWQEEEFKAAATKPVKGVSHAVSWMTVPQILEDIQKQAKEMKKVRWDAKFEFSEIQCTFDMDLYRVAGRIRQRAINLPSDYEVYFAPIGGTRVEDLKIWNKFGRMEWERPIELEDVEFGNEELLIKESFVACYPNDLNSPCKVFFNSLPRKVTKTLSESGQRAAEATLRTLIQQHKACYLQSVNFSANCYSVYF